MCSDIASTVRAHSTTGYTMDYKYSVTTASALFPDCRASEHASPQSWRRRRLVWHDHGSEADLKRLWLRRHRLRVSSRLQKLRDRLRSVCTLPKELRYRRTDLIYITNLFYINIIDIRDVMFCTPNSSFFFVFVFDFIIPFFRHSEHQQFQCFTRPFC